MNMRKIALIMVAFGLWAFAAAAQDATTADPESKEAASKKFSEDYRRQVSRLGASGVGVETMLTNWEKVDPENKELLLGWYAFYLSKSQSTDYVTRSEKRYLGSDALFSLKDSLGNDIYYFQNVTYDDSLFTIALQSIDKAIDLYPKDLNFRYVRCAGLIMYEGGSPDMALVDALNVIDAYNSDPKDWEYEGEGADWETFSSIINEICVLFYNLGTPSSYRAFKTLSEKMLEIDKDDTEFILNVGTYYFIAERDYKTALKYYDRVLKIKPNDYAAAKNRVLVAREQKNKKMEKKYLPALIESTPDNAERLQSEARLKSL